MQITRLIVAVILMTIALVSGCSSKPRKPTQADVERAFGVMIASESEGRLKLSALTETREEQTIAGKVRWMVSAEVECVEDGIWLSSGSKESAVPLSIEFSGPDAEEAAKKLEELRRYPNDFQTAAAESAKDKGPSIRAGERFQVVGVLTLSRDKKEWEADLFTMKRTPGKLK